jgi:hypothetical protein
MPGTVLMTGMVQWSERGLGRRALCSWVKANQQAGSQFVPSQPLPHVPWMAKGMWV